MAWGTLRALPEPLTPTLAGGKMPRACEDLASIRSPSSKLRSRVPSISFSAPAVSSSARAPLLG
eukprot:4023639-Pyramimonas_sp.AAC.1